MPQISVMIKPASSNCNMACKYCFYNDESKNKNALSHGMMNTETMENVISNAYSYANGDVVFLSFSGGEPLLAGKAFFKTALKMLDRLNTRNSPVYISIDTNGTLIDEEWCDIFKNNNILIFLALDGDKVANKNRIDREGNDTFDRVLKSAKLMRDKEVLFNIKAVVTKENALHIDRIYTFFIDEGFVDLQFIPCLKPQSKDIDDSFYVDSKSYTLYLLSLFALYQKDRKNGRYVSIRQFENFIRLTKFQPAELCGMNGYCNRQFIVEGDGDVYPCEHYCTDTYLLGNINEKSFSELEKTERAETFLKEGLVIPDECKACNFFMLCRGGCKRERVDLDKCEAYKTFFKYAIPYLKSL